MKVIGFIIIVIIASINHCWSQSVTSTSIQETEDNIMRIPNAFTPNGDGMNDYFRIYNITDQTVVEFIVFNRWGTIMYRSNEKDAAWDGTFKNIPQETGVYGYNIQIKNAETGKTNIYKGTVTLLR